MSDSIAISNTAELQPVHLDALSSFLSTERSLAICSC